MDTKFKKGSTPFNKGKSRSEYLTPELIEKQSKTQFQEGVTTGEKHPHWNGGVQTPKNSCVILWAGKGEKRKRRPREIYEAHNGPIPEGYVIYHLDRIKTNDSPDNLIAVSRADLMRLNNENKTIEL
jgi:hypothetical protein